jgi:acyl-coenzyme A synthetase/AMP-(fatty) acid ligase
MGAWQMTKLGPLPRAHFIGSYKTPKRVLIRDTLPKGPSGKIQRLKLSA